MQNQQQLKPSKLWFYDIKITCVTGHVSAPLINRMHNSTMHGGFMNFIDITIIYCKIAAVHSSAGETADHIELAISRITCNELNWIEPTLRTLYVSYEIFAFSPCSIRWRSTMSMIHENWNQPKPPYSQFVQNKEQSDCRVSSPHLFIFTPKSERVLHLLSLSIYRIAAQTVSGQSNAITLTFLTFIERLFAWRVFVCTENNKKNLFATCFFSFRRNVMCRARALSIKHAHCAQFKIK